MTARGFAVQQRFAPRHWVALLSEGGKPVLKIGSAGPDVRRLQRALSAADPSARVTATGVFDAKTDAALRDWQERVGPVRHRRRRAQHLEEALAGHRADVTSIAPARLLARYG